VNSNASAVLHREWCHALLSVSCPILHKRAAQVTVSKLPRATKIGDAIANVRFGLKQSGQRAPVAQHGRRCRTDLHETDLTDPSNSARIISTLDLHYRIRDIRRKPHLLGFTPDCIKMNFTPGCMSLRHPDEALNDGRQWDIREIS
jgi:hypothetical protein